MVERPIFYLDKCGKFRRASRSSNSLVQRMLLRSVNYVVVTLQLSQFVSTCENRLKEHSAKILVGQLIEGPSLIEWA